jgi:hypothetical protein
MIEVLSVKNILWIFGLKNHRGFDYKPKTSKELLDEIDGDR